MNNGGGGSLGSQLANRRDGEERGRKGGRQKMVCGVGLQIYRSSLLENISPLG